MKADEQIQKAEKALLAAGARQYVKATVQDFMENALTGLEATLGAKEVSMEKTLTTLGGIMAMRQFLRRIDADIRRGQEGNAPPSR